MKLWMIQWVMASAMVGASLGQDAPVPGGGISEEFKRRSAQAMVSADPAKRRIAYSSWQYLDKAAMPEYRKALEAANRQHSKRLDDISRARGTANPYAAHYDGARQLAEERARVMPLILTDWKKDPAKIKMLRDEMKDMEKLWSRVERMAAGDTTKFDTALDAVIDSMMEVVRELERLDKESDTADMDDEELRTHVYRNHVEGELLLKQREMLAATRRQAAALAAATKGNRAAGKWASSAMKDFSILINKERCIMGLAPLRLEEKLSDAARGHSGDMARLGFFAHQSPVPGKASPWDRARVAGFTGSPLGENIFMGSTSPDAAYHAWFGSDGHRHIMFGNGSLLGVGIAGSHWTMMTGN